MKKLSYLPLVLCFAPLGAIPFAQESAMQVQAAGTPTYASSAPTKNITLRDNSESEIKAYYDSLAGLEESELKGINLLKNLKPLLQNFTYYPYDAVWKIYEITDREWALSPAANDTYGSTSFDSVNNVYTTYTYGTSVSGSHGNDPYVHTLYRNRDSNGVTVEEGRIKEWDTHNGTDNATNREHVWCQSRGFKAPEGAEGPAGTDVHHLISGDAYVNQQPHNNTPYGFVNRAKIDSKTLPSKTWLAGNIRGTAITAHAGDETTNVFEPQDSDKGDIARACFYMAACYNNISGNETITQYNPNLTLANYATSEGNSEISSAENAVAMGTLSDLLSWHRMDPVDEYEIHRNNLIFNNYQHNRNPFIDFPEWVDYIWGTTTYDTSVPKTLTYDNTPTGSVDLEKDVLYGYREAPIEPVDPTPEETDYDDWVKASEIRVGDEVAIVTESDPSGTFSLGELGYINTNAVGLKNDIEIEEGKFAHDDALSLTVCEGSVDDSFALKTEEDTYLSWSSGNTLTSADSITDNSSWTVEFSQGIATITNVADATRKLQWNKGSPRFACYTSNQTAVSIYKTARSDASNWASDFLTTWTAGCDPNGVSSALSWDAAATAVSSKHALVKSLLASAIHDSSTIGLAVERYDYIIGKYPNLDDFLNRSLVNSAHIAAINNDQSENPIWIVIALTSAACLVLPVFVLMARKREHGR